MRRNRLVPLLLTSLLATAMSVAAPSRAAGVETTTTVVRQFNIGSWFGVNEGPAGSSAEFDLVFGPKITPAGGGSAQLFVNDEGRASLFSQQYAGTHLDAFTQLEYWAYVENPNAATTPVLQFDVDYDSTDTDVAYQGRLTFLPGAIPVGEWTHLDALAGAWYASRAPGNTICTQSAPCTWAEVLAHFPDAAIWNQPFLPGAFVLRLGGPIAGGALSFVDNLTVATVDATEVVDFETGASLNPAIAKAGDQVTVRAYGFKTKASVVLKYATGLKKKFVVGCRTRVNSGTGALCSFTVPDLGPFGIHKVTIKGRNAIKGAKPLVYALDLVRIG